MFQEILTSIMNAFNYLWDALNNTPSFIPNMSWAGFFAGMVGISILIEVFAKLLFGETVTENKEYIHNNYVKWRSRK